MSFFINPVLAAEYKMSKFGGEVEAGLLYDVGTIKNADATIPGRNVTATSVFTSFGARLWNIVPFVQFQYRFINQISDTSESHNQNLSGDAYFLAGGFKFRLSRFVPFAGYYFYGNYHLSKKTTDDLEASYSQPSGYFGGLSYQINRRLSLIFLYSNIDFSQRRIGSQDYDISNNRLNHENLSVGVGWLF